jgi:hypothetical protein
MSSAEIAQLVEHFTRNEGVVGSSPIFSFEKKPWKRRVSGAFVVSRQLSDLSIEAQNSRKGIPFSILIWKTFWKIKDHSQCSDLHSNHIFKEDDTYE